jgi:K+-sensing histidine kinase KdpD
VRRFGRPGSSPLVGTVLGIVAVGVVMGALLPFRGDVSPAVPALVLVLPVVLAGLVGGGRAAAVVAVAAALAFNVGFIEPFWTLDVSALEDAIALFVFLAVALAIGTLVSLEVDSRRAAEQRAAELAELYERLERLSAERQRLAEESARVALLERVDEQRSSLLRSVSHDLRTPLASIRAIASDLREGTPYDDRTRDELLGTVCDEAERLDRLVGNLLSMSRIEAGALHPDRQAVDVEELVGECARRLGRLFCDVRVDTDFADDLPLVDGDYSQLDQVVTNLLENASRHAPRGSVVRIGAHADDGSVVLHISDEGVGVAAADAEAIFEPFRTGDGSMSSGLGLAICRALVEAHGGAVWLEPGSKRGATFNVRLPARA